MKWDAAAAAAADIAQDWAVEDGPGGAIVLFDHRDIRAEVVGGLADLANELPFRTDTAIRYASISKHFLCSLLLSGTPIGLDDRLGQHLILPDAAAAVTVGRALDMTGGLPDLVETLSLLGIPSSTLMSRHRLMDAATLLLDRLNFEPGHEISYSNTGYRLVQAALAARGIDYPALLRDRLLRALGLSIRFPEDETSPVPALATGYWRSQSGWRIGRYGMHISASGGLAGNAIDLASWGQALLADRAPVTGLLSRLTAPRHLADGRATQYGLGLARSEIGGRTLFGHGGSLPGFRSHLLLDPAAHAGVVVLSNRDDTDAGAIAQTVMAAMHGVVLPTPAVGLLSEGMFVTDDGPFWLKQRAGQVTYLGATETVVDAGAGWAANGSAPLPMRLMQDGADIVGEIGHVARRFRPVRRAEANPGWAGTYVKRLPHAEARLMVTVERGVARIHVPPLGTALDLRPLDHRRALMQRSEGASTQQICCSFEANSVTLVMQRARSLVFERSA